MTDTEVPRSEIRTILAPHEVSGRQLILAAAMVGDEEDFGVWSWRCRDWTSRLSDALRYLYGSDAVRVFARVSPPSRPLATWQETLHAELDRLGQTIEMLSELVAEPDSAPGSEPPRGERAPDRGGPAAEAHEPSGRLR